MVGIVTDMAKKKKISQKIIESEMSLRSIFKVLPDLLFQIDEDMRFINVQTSKPEQLLAPIDQIIGKYTHDILPGEIATLTKQKYHEAMKNGGVELYYYDLNIHNDKRSYETRMVPCTENSVLAIVRDVTDIKKYERKIKESEARYNAIVNEQTDLVCRFLPDLRLIFVNKAYCDFWGRSQDELIGHSFLLRLQAKDRLRIQNDILSLGPEKEVITHDHEVIQEGGEVRYVEWTTRIIHDDTPDKIEYQGVGRDITERKRLQNKLMALSEREQRYFAQELHDGLCQDLKGLEIEIALMEGRLRDVGIDYVQMAQSIGQQVNSAVKKAYSIAHGMLPFELDVKSFATALIDLAKQAGDSHDQTITVSIDKDLFPKSKSHAYQLYRIAQEAIYNALNHAKATEIILSWYPDWEGVFLSIQDNGIGMDVALSKKSKGMGLIVMQSRAEGIGAHFMISSAPAEGTTVLVRFPMGSV